MHGAAAGPLRGANATSAKCERVSGVRVATLPHARARINALPRARVSASICLLVCLSVCLCASACSRRY
eukprot:13184945-Alexandrium_andersonii.AAC.1